MVVCHVNTTLFSVRDLTPFASCRKRRERYIIQPNRHSTAFLCFGFGISAMAFTLAESGLTPWALKWCPIYYTTLFTLVLVSFC